jgi:glycosyltransferase involved in cell wall biosynthesis
MRSCPIFLSFSEREGFGLPPAEAMASGCFVVGFTGMGGRDYFDPEYSSPVLENDILGYARAAEEAMRRYDSDPESLAKAGLVASERVVGRYHDSGLREDLLELYRPLLAR